MKKEFDIGMLNRKIVTIAAKEFICDLNAIPLICLIFVASSEFGKVVTVVTTNANHASTLLFIVIFSSILIFIYLNCINKPS